MTEKEWAVRRRLVMDLLEENATKRELAELLGVSTETIYGIIKNKKPSNFEGDDE
jgi:transposase